MSLVEANESEWHYFSGIWLQTTVLAKQLKLLYSMVRGKLMWTLHFITLGGWTNMVDHQTIVTLPFIEAWLLAWRTTKTSMKSVHHYHQDVTLYCYMKVPSQHFRLKHSVTSKLSIICLSVCVCVCVCVCSRVTLWLTYSLSVVPEERSLSSAAVAQGDDQS